MGTKTQEIKQVKQLTPQKGPLRLRMSRTSQDSPLHSVLEVLA